VPLAVYLRPSLAVLHTEEAGQMGNGAGSGGGGPTGGGGSGDGPFRPIIG
jgi:hypothetical protein